VHNSKFVQTLPSAGGMNALYHHWCVPHGGVEGGNRKREGASRGSVSEIHLPIEIVCGKLLHGDNSWLHQTLSYDNEMSRPIIILSDKTFQNTSLGEDGIGWNTSQWITGNQGNCPFSTGNSALSPPLTLIYDLLATLESCWLTNSLKAYRSRDCVSEWREAYSGNVLDIGP